MTQVNGEQIYHILQNLSNLEAAFLDFSVMPRNFIDYSTYIDFFNTSVIRDHGLGRFYFQRSFDSVEELPEKITDLGDIDENLQILPDFDFSMSKQFNFPNPLIHACNYFSLLYLMEGRGTLQIGSSEFSFLPGDFVMIPAKTPYSINTIRESICICYNIRSSFVAHEYQSIFQDDQSITRFLMDAASSPGKKHYLFMHTDNTPAIRELALNCFAEEINQANYFRNAMKNYLSLMFTIALRDDKTTIEASMTVSQCEQHYRDILDYVNKNYKTATLDSTAAYVRFSKQYVCRIVKRSSGMTFNSLLNSIRLEIVSRYLRESTLSIEAITDISGFANSAHMSRLFREHFGMTPSQYRRELPM